LIYAVQRSAEEFGRLAEEDHLNRGGSSDQVTTE
jgi:hypothetical protein